MDRQTPPNDLDTAPREPVTRPSLASDLRALGLVEGATVIVHTSMARLGPVTGGAQAVISALLDTLGERGTLVMPAHSGQLSDPAHWRAPPAPEAWWDTIRQEMPAYDPALTPTRNMGAVAESFRTYPGVRRSAHPQVSFAARGPLAERIVGEHSLQSKFGEDSPWQSSTNWTRRFCWRELIMAATRLSISAKPVLSFPEGTNCVKARQCWSTVSGAG